MKSEKNNITRRTFIKELGIVSTSTLSFLSVNTPANINSPTDLNKNNPEKPNILLLMTDQMRWDAMGCSGDWVNTPNLDRIASEGIRFTNCVTTSPVCVPARLSLATGLYPHNTGVWNNQKHKMSSNTPTWMQSVRDAGYRTSLFGKTHLHPHSGDLREKEDLMNAYGLDDVDEIGGPRANMKTLSHMTAIWKEKGIWEAYRNDYQERFRTKPHLVRPSPNRLEYDADVYVGKQAKKYLKTYNRNEPWFCWVSFGGPHEPWDTPEPYSNIYNPIDMPFPITRPPIGDRPRGRLDQIGGKRKPDFDIGDVAKMRADYAGNVTLIDDQIGEILDTIQERGELDNTVIIFCSDHGEMNGDYGLIYKSNFLNGAVRIPFIVRTPDTIGRDITNRICDTPVEWIDIGPTLVEYAGGQLQHQQFGKSLSPVINDNEVTHREFAISEISREIMLLNQEWKIALNKDKAPYLLFNIHDDPNETDNLAGKPKMKDIERKLKSRIVDYLSKTNIKKG